MKFSERYGHVTPRVAFQESALDEATRNRLINLVIQNCLTHSGPIQLTGEGAAFFAYLIDEFFKTSMDAATDRYDHACAMMAKWSKGAKWFSILDLLEFVIAYYVSDDRKYLIDQSNRIFEEEKVGYRFVRGQITPITDRNEIESIEAALNAASEFGGVKEHIERALELYSDRRNPDYRNSIKEAISAVESACKVISKKTKATLPDALKVIEKRHTLHPALKAALTQLYGYSSDKQGIRHALIDGANVGHAEAKFMLIGCSAFCNYLIEQCGE